MNPIMNEVLRSFCKIPSRRNLLPDFWDRKCILIQKMHQPSTNLTLELVLMDLDLLFYPQHLSNFLVSTLKHCIRTQLFNLLLVHL